MIEKGKEAYSSGGSGAPLWIPDESKQYAPVLLTFTVSNKSQQPTTPVYLQLLEPGGARYLPLKVPIQALAPGGSYKISLALQPADDPAFFMKLLPTVEDYQKNNVAKPNSLEHAITYANIQAKVKNGYATLEAWKQKYTTGTVNFQVDLLALPWGSKYEALKTNCGAAPPKKCTVQ
jgi:hypothetical protein